MTATAPPCCARVAARAAALLVALLVSLGPLGLLQMVAWTGMAFDYGARYGVVAGLERTFDGQHPCVLCEGISKVRQETKQTNSDVSLTPVKLVCLVAPVGAVALAAPSREDRDYFIAQEFLSGRTDRPAPPPPRTLAA